MKVLDKKSQAVREQISFSSQTRTVMGQRENNKNDYFREFPRQESEQKYFYTVHQASILK